MRKQMPLRPIPKMSGVTFQNAFGLMKTNHAGSSLRTAFISIIVMQRTRENPVKCRLTMKQKTGVLGLNPNFNMCLTIKNGPDPNRKRVGNIFGAK